LAELRKLVDSYSTPLDFFIQTINYEDKERARILDEVLNRLLQEIGRYAGTTDLERLKNWAAEARCDGYKAWGIRGFALAGFQYLRMLFGADTVKPDIHLHRFVSNCIGKPVSDYQVIKLLEGVACRIGCRVRDLDTTIWESSARQQSKRTHKCGCNSPSGRSAYPPAYSPSI
jgi:hypothetical protein